jgi:hypothetical protein
MTPTTHSRDPDAITRNSAPAIEAPLLPFVQILLFDSLLSHVPFGLQSLRWAKRDASLTLAESPKNFFIQIFAVAGFQWFAFDQLERSGAIGLALST